MSKNTIYLSALGLLVLAIGIATVWYSGLGEKPVEGGPPPGPLVETMTAHPAVRAPFIAQTGFIRAGRSIIVSPEVAGRIDEVTASFRIGQRVAADEPLVTLDRERFEASLTQARAQLEQAQAEVSTARRELSRQKKLIDEGFVSPETLDRSEAAAIRAAAQVDVARAAVRNAELGLDDAALSAPFDAIVADESATLGAFVQAGGVLGELAATSHAKILVGLSARQYSEVGGQALLDADVRIIPENQPDQEVIGKVIAISPQMDTQTRTIDVEVHIARPFDGPSPLVLNTLAQVHLPARVYSGQLFSLPIEALQSGNTLWRVSPDSTLSRIDAQIVHQSDDTAYVVSKDLAADDRLLTTPIQNPLDGLPVRLADNPGQMVRR